MMAAMVPRAPVLAGRALSTATARRNISHVTVIGGGLMVGGSEPLSLPDAHLEGHAFGSWLGILTPLFCCTQGSGIAQVAAGSQHKVIRAS